MELTVAGKLLVCITLLSLVYTPSFTADYCGYKCFEGQHTMCRYKEGIQGSKCVDYRNASFTDKQKKDIIHVQNMMRNDIATGTITGTHSGQQPKAANMMQLVWDDELAELAQRWADQCTFEHDSCRRVDRFIVGQNIARNTTATEFTVQDICGSMDMWFDEVNDFNTNIIKKYTTSASSHYTQLAWAATGAVGCGASIYRTGENEFTVIMVCNYGPSGNRPSEPMYLIGEACSACPEDTKCSSEYDGLCFSPGYAKKKRDIMPVSEVSEVSAASAPVACGILFFVEVAASWLLYARVR